MKNGKKSGLNCQRNKLRKPFKWMTPNVIQAFCKLSSTTNNRKTNSLFYAFNRPWPQKQTAWTWPVRGVLDPCTPLLGGLNVSKAFTTSMKMIKRQLLLLDASRQWLNARDDDVSKPLRSFSFYSPSCYFTLSELACGQEVELMTRTLMSAIFLFAMGFLAIDPCGKYSQCPVPRSYDPLFISLSLLCSKSLPLWKKKPLFQVMKLKTIVKSLWISILWIEWM